MAIATVLAFVAAIPAQGALFDRLFAPKARLWERWTVHQPSSTAVVDHRPWSALLARYVTVADDGIARFAYRDVDAQDRRLLEDYLASLSQVPIDEYGRGEQRAFWINLYNALTVSIVLERYPVASIRDIDLSSGLFSRGPWKAKRVSVAGQMLSLNDIEHRILRPIWRDARLHYAVNCASIGCPNLAREAFTAANTEELLERAARAYVNHPRGAHFAGESLIVSSIYVWFEGDFVAHSGSVLSHLRRYAEGDLAARLAAVSRFDDHAYDWRLNDADASPR
ncbi:MAG: DUF547 domain-containing protein [Gammaproteobacteria bacterium]|nr:DUF547 domain-containing protein [Gammaproteobacteria bacterium]